jgi:hypothetical protein
MNQTNLPRNIYAHRSMPVEQPAFDTTSSGVIFPNAYKIDHRLFPPAPSAFRAVPFS